MLISKKHLSLYEPEPTILLENSIKNLALLFGTKKSEAFTVFLSHKHNETEILKQAVQLLTYIGVDVYIDWQDNNMPVETSGETADKIKKKIIENKKFILLATDLAIESKWCNWELGFAVSIKYPHSIAIMPIVENDGNWKGNEYLQIYPTIRTNFEIFKGDYFVEFNNGRTKLEVWLKQ